MSDSSKVVRPEDAIPDSASTYVANGGVQVRKGTVAAFIENARTLSTLNPGSADYEAVAGQLRELAPGMAAAGVFDVFEVRSVAIREIIAGAY
ncbi:hypothetical protein HH310_28655 [Actinoplanes sp. TBRC 11911]|uniref:hypothetical protein n=1 Tax=Actinoplanes sp. TBRC 11911 TaxID=2729386 RepID=UPI00145C79F3|nr:hypothetical protein [Actinoplanes sp. TBRC 11911]NMO55144.1 hypothetical protein [Actinoplanes sp. TBRC 11911]